MQTPYTDNLLRHALIKVRERELARLQPQPIVRRVTAKRGKLQNRIERNKHSDSMMAAGHPKFMRPIIQADARTKRLREAYRSRLAAKHNAPSFDRAPVGAR